MGTGTGTHYAGAAVWTVTGSERSKHRVIVWLVVSDAEGADSHRVVHPCTDGMVTHRERLTVVEHHTDAVATVQRPCPVVIHWGLVVDAIPDAD